MKASGIEHLPKVLPAGWSEVYETPDGMAYQSGGLRVICSVDTELDGRLWLHVSVSRGMRIPSWDDLRLVKDIFVGDRYAYQVFPTKEKYVNINPFCLHLWCPLEGEQPLPDFTRGGKTI
jgi:hypothetical protein